MIERGYVIEHPESTPKMWGTRASRGDTVHLKMKPVGKAVPDTRESVRSKEVKKGRPQPALSVRCMGCGTHLQPAPMARPSEPYDTCSSAHVRSQGEAGRRVHAQRRFLAD